MRIAIAGNIRAIDSLLRSRQIPKGAERAAAYRQPSLARVQKGYRIGLVGRWQMSVSPVAKTRIVQILTGV